MVCDNWSVGEVTGSTHKGSGVPGGQADGVSTADGVGVRVRVGVGAFAWFLVRVRTGGTPGSRADVCVRDGSTIGEIDGDGVNVEVGVCVCVAVVVEETTASEAVGGDEVGALVTAAGAQLITMVAITSSDGISRYFPRMVFIVPSSAAGQ